MKRNFAYSSDDHGQPRWPGASGSASGEAGPSGDKAKVMQGALGAGWVLGSLCSQSPSVTTSLCWAGDKVGSCLVPGDLQPSASDLTLAPAGHAQVGVGSWEDSAPSPSLSFSPSPRESPEASSTLDIKEKYCTVASAREVIMRI